MDGEELTPALERVAASVVETHRKRQQVEDELKAAAAAVASLQAHALQLESSVVDLQRQLEVTLAAKKQEDAALAELASKRTAALERLASAAKDIQSFLDDKDRTAAAISTHIEESRSHLASVSADIDAAKGTLSSLGGEARALRDKLAPLRETADSADRALSDVESKARDLNAAADVLATRISGIAGAIDKAEKSKQNVVAESDELRTASSALEARKAEAQQAVAAVADLIADREKRGALLAEHLEVIDDLCGGSASGGAASSSVQGNGATEAPALDQTPSPARFEQPSQPKKFSSTIETLELLASLGYLRGDEVQGATDLLKAGDVDKFVRSLWSRAVAGPGQYRLAIAQALSESGDEKAALTFFNKALEGKQVDPFTTYLVGIALLPMKRYVEVLKIAQALGRTRAGKMLGRNVEALHLQSTGRADEAEKKLAEALDMIGYPKAHYNETMHNLARLAQSRGDVKTAIAWREKLCASDPMYRDVARDLESMRAGAHAG